MSHKKRLLSQFNLNNNWFKSSLVNISDEESNQRIHPNMNHIKYLAGHLVNAQYGFAAISEAPVARKWDDLFAGSGKTKALDDFPYPTLEEIKAEWNQTFPVIQKALEALPEEILNKDFPNSFLAGTGVFDGTIGDFWAFMNLHQMYHIGQIGILRRALGKDALKRF